MGSTISALKRFKRSKQRRMDTITQDFPTTLHVYYAVVCALLRGDPLSRHPPIPVELVLLIFEGFQSREFSVYPSETPVYPQHVPTSGEDDNDRERRLYMHSEPLNRRFLDLVVEIRLLTVIPSWVWVGLAPPARWTGFEIGILRPTGEDPQQTHPNIVNFDLKFQNTRSTPRTLYTPVLRSNGTDYEVLRWVSHRNQYPCYMTSGTLFGPDHEIWRILREGDVICVYARAIYWPTIEMKSGRLVMYGRFDPMGLSKHIG